MLEILVKKHQENRKIALVEDGKLVEYYEENLENERKYEGNIYVGEIKNIIKGMQAAFIDLGIDKPSFIHAKDILPKVDEKVQKVEDDIDIVNIVKNGQKLLVQVKKDSNDKKGARVSTHISLPGKYVVFMPNTEIVTVSQKILDEKEQERLIKIVKDNVTSGNGAIIRTSAMGKEKEIIQEIKKLENKWLHILEEFNKNKDNKGLIYKSEDIVEKMLLDLTNKDLERIVTNDKSDYSFIKKVKEENIEYKDLKIQVKSEDDVFKVYDIEKQIEKIKDRKVWLKCGGFITIDQTEALTAIDVNTGKYIGKKDLEETVCKVNEQATIEVAKQLRLRDIGGIIIIDYIDMKKKENKEKIEKLLKECLKHDRTKTQVEGFTKLDLMEMTRKHICSHN